MHIVKLTSENIKRIEAIEVKPDGKSIVIGGRNAQGKTSLLDSIEMALGGTRHVPEQPIRQGEEKARVVVDLDEIVVERRFTPGGSQLVVTNKEGLRYQTPQGLLDNMVGNLAFDPVAFVRMKPADQIKALKDLAGLNFDDLDAKRHECYTNRTAVNRMVRSYEEQLAAMNDPGDISELDRVDVDELRAELEAHRTQIGKRRECEGSIKMIDQRIQHREDQIRKLQEEITELRNDKAMVKQQLDNLPEQDETREIQSRIDEAYNLNACIDEAKRYNEMKAKLREVQEQSEALTEQIEKIDLDKQLAMANAQYPVENLSFNDNGLTLNGIPFKQCSSGEQLKVAVAMGVQQNPKIKILLIRDGAFMDEETLADVKAIADEHDAQLWIERVGDGEECQVIIEDGNVKQKAEAADEPE